MKSVGDAVNGVSLMLTALFIAAFNPAIGANNSIYPEEPFPAAVKDIDGNRIDVARLAREKLITVVTLKATWCPVCQEQLRRLKESMSRINTQRVTFLVLSPGPEKDLHAIKERIGFPYPFIEDRNLEIAKSLGLKMGEKEIVPAILILNRERKIRWMQSGRNGWYFGDEELLKEIGLGVFI